MIAWARVFSTLFAVPLLLAIFSTTVARHPLSPWVVVNVAAWPLITFASITFHELGHAAVAELVGLHPRVIQLGLGRELTRWKRGQFEIRLHSLPLLGLTFLSARSAGWLRLKMFFTIAAGPLASGLLLWILMKVSGLGFVVPIPTMAGQPALWETAIFMNGLMMVFNLLPLTFSAGYQTDGRLILGLPFMKQRRLAEWLTVDLVLEAQTCIERHDLVQARACAERILTENASSFGGRMMLAAIALDGNEHANARQVLETLRAEPPPDEISRLVLANNLAWAHFLAGDESLLTEADELSLEVSKKLKSAPFALGTRGAILLWKGRLDEARSMLQTAHVTNPSAHGRALNACCVAMTYAKGGDAQRARDWLEKARADDPGCMLLPRALAASDEQPRAA